jgi:hypothetical protein
LTTQSSIIKTDHDDSIRNSESETHQTPTDAMTDRNGISALTCHAPVHAIVANLTTNQGPKARRCVGGDVTTCGAWHVFHGPCRQQKRVMANRPPTRPPETTSSRNRSRRSNCQLSINLPCTCPCSTWGSDNAPWPQSQRAPKVMVRATVFDRCSGWVQMRSMLAHPALQRESGTSVLGALALVLVRFAGA